MKYSVQFVTYNTIEVEADNEDEAYREAERRFPNEAEALWDEFDIQEVR